MGHSLAYRRILTRMGYYEYQRGLIFHHLSEEGGWNTHLKKCRDWVLKAVEYHKPSTITVLGSGWLLDFPLMEINERVKKVNLVDIIHPPEVKSQAASLKNVILIEEDISGGLISEVWNKTDHGIFFNRLRSLEGINIPEYLPRYETGLVISLNILTQLEALPVALLRKKTSVDENSYFEFRKRIQQNHIRFLRLHKSLLITDLEEVVTQTSGNVSAIKSVVADIPEGIFREEWTWHFDLLKSDFYRKRSVFTVAAIIL